MALEGALLPRRVEGWHALGDVGLREHVTSTGSSRTLDSVTKVKQSYDWDEVEALFADAEPSTHDDVSITDDGRRLNSIEAVRAFFDEIRSSRAAAADE